MRIVGFDDNSLTNQKSEIRNQKSLRWHAESCTTVTAAAILEIQIATKHTLSIVTRRTIPASSQWEVFER